MDYDYCETTRNNSYRNWIISTEINDFLYFNDNFMTNLVLIRLVLS